MQCPGCQAKVIVKHEELLGKSLPCPKCKHLIIVPKQGPISNLSGAPSREPSPSFDSTALTKDDYGDWDEVLSNLPQNPLGVDPEQIDWSPIGAGDEASDDRIHFQPIDTAPPQPSTASDWQSRNVKKRRQLLLVATIAVLSSVMAAIGFFSFLTFMKSDQTAQANQPQPSTENSGQAPLNPDGNTKETGAASPPTENNPSPPDEKSSTQEPPNESPAGDNGNTGPVVIPSPNSDATNNAALDPSNNNTMANGSPDGKTADQSPPSPDKKPTDANSEAANESADFVYKLPPELQRVKDLLNNNRGTFGSDAGFRPPSSVADLNLENIQYPDKDLFYPDSKMLGDWKQMSSLNISKMSAPNDVPLAIGLEEFARITNIGVTIDWQSCVALGVEWNPLITIKFEDKTISSFLEETLASKGLSLSLDAKGFPIVKPTVAPNEKVEQVRWDLTDVCVPGFEKQTADLLISMCDVQDYCTQVDGALVWNENASQVDKAKVFETIRHLAKLIEKPIPSWPSTEKFKAPQFSVDAWRESRSTIDLTMPAEAIVTESRSAIGILHEAALLTDTQIVVDWKAAWGHGLTPTEEMIIVLRNRTLTQVAKKILVEYALELVPIGSRTFWLTTGQVRQTSLCVVPIKPPAELNLDLVKRTLSKLRPLGEDGLSRFQMRPVPGRDGIYFARICPPNTETILQDEFRSVFGWQ